jgi:thiol-disulfide isomerase/thioredoxin
MGGRMPSLARMGGWFLLAGLVDGVGGVSGSRAAERKAPVGLSRWAGGPTPPLTLEELSGARVALGSFRGKTVVVNFWATWCEPCRTEMPRLEKLRTKYADGRLNVYGVVLSGADDDVVSRFVRDLGVGYPILRGTPELSERWGGIGVIPTTFLVDENGRIVRRYVGATDETVRGIESDVAALLEPKPDPAPAPAPPRSRLKG